MNGMDREIDLATRRRRLIRRLTIGTAIVVVTGGLLVLAAGWLRPSIHRARSRFATVERGDLEAILQASGTVVPASERVISSPVEARIERILELPGELLKEGDPILELDTAAARLQIERLEEQLAQVENDGVQKKLELEDSLDDLTSRIETGRLDLEIAAYRLEQNRKLDIDGLVPAEKLRESEVELKKATIQLQRLEEQVASARRVHRARLDRLALDASILRKERDDARRRLELATTCAPVSGVLTWVNQEVGATVGVGDVLARIADLDSFRVEASVADAYASRLETGQPVRVLIEKEPLPGRVSAVLPTIESGAVRINVELDDPAHSRLRQNLRVDVLVVTGFRADVLRAPRGPYIQGGGDRHHVFVVNGERVRRTDVRLGLVGHEYYEVVEGLEDGDEIVISDMRNYQHARELRLK
jgi:HlyD family secretion protein